MKNIRDQQGAVTLVLVTIIMLAIVMALSISNWVNIQRRGDTQRRIAVREHYLAQNAIQEMRLRMAEGAIGPCVRNIPQTFTYFIVDGSTVTVQVDCNPFP